MAEQKVSFDGRSFFKYLSRVNKGEQAFVMAKTLTQVAADARKTLRKEAAEAWTIRKPGALNGFRMKAATKSNPVSVVGHTDWYAVDQIDSTPSTRTPERAKWLYQPLSGTKVGRNGKKTPYAPKRAVTLATAARGKRTGRKKVQKPFFIKQSGGTMLIAQRQGKAKAPLNLLYRMVRNQRIMPKVSMVRVAQKSAARGQAFFNRNINQSIQKNR